MIGKIKKKEAKVGVIGLGYVGLPLVMEFIEVGFNVMGFDMDEKKVDSINAGQSYIRHIDGKRVLTSIQTGRLSATSDFGKLSKMDAILICVPTPLDQHREPDMSYVFDSTRTIAKTLRKGQLVVLESTTYPGTTDRDMRLILEETGLKAGKDFFLAYSPEREDPNNPKFSTGTIPKVVGGFSAMCLKTALALYDSIVVKTVPVESTSTAEATKLLENIFRSVNIALVNELKVLFDRMDIDVWKVIEAASTKPFGYMPFFPGPGLGGHCIPIDPFYLTWKAREYEIPTRFIELAGEINVSMPRYVVGKVMSALNQHKKSLRGSRILILGLAYKKDIDDIRESPSLKLIELLAEGGAKVDFNDPYVSRTHKMRKYNFQMKSVPLTPAKLEKYDCVLVATDHTKYDRKFIYKHSKLLVDTRNMFGNFKPSKKVIKA
ncbi:MAG: nucleotide sugar dehydrogenase [Nitrospinota bacterium]